MADQKPTSLYYQNLGGINTKASEYTTGVAQFLSLYNMDFDTPNALSKRPGSTQLATGNSGPITSLFEFIKLEGQSYVIAGTDTAMFYVAAGGYTLLSAGWNNGQPTDMLTFVNKLWLANGQNFSSWNATNGISLYAYSSTQQITLNVPYDTNFNGATFFNFLGLTMSPVGNSFTLRGLYAAYSYVRSDGYVGPADFQNNARNMGIGRPFSNGDEFFSALYTQTLGGLTMPSGIGLSAIQVWLAADYVDSTSPTQNIGGSWGIQRIGNLGWEDRSGGTTSRRMSVTLKPNADVSRFHLFKTISGGSLILAGGGQLGITLLPLVDGWTFDSLAAVSSDSGFSGLPFSFLATYIPKYIEVSQNIMFMAGFSVAPSTVWFSEVGAPENLQADYNFEVRTNDGDRIFALTAYQNQLMVFKETSFHRLIGNSSDNFDLIQVSAEYGCISNRCAITYKNDIAFLDRRGIVNFDGANWSIISHQIDDVFRRMNLSAARENAAGVHHLYRNQIWFAIPVDGSTVNNLTVVYDYLVQGFTYFDGYTPSSYAYMKAQLNNPTVWRGSYSGNLHATGSSYYSDSGRAITCMAFSRFENVIGQNETSIWRRFFLDVSTASGTTGLIQGQVFSNYDHSTVRATFSIYQDAFQTRAEMGVAGKATAFQISHNSASLPLQINGYGWATRALRNV